MTTDDPMCVWNVGVTLIPRSAVLLALEPTLLIDILSPNERYSHAIGRVRRCPRRLVNKRLHTRIMGYGQATSVYAYLYESSYHITLF